MFPNKNWTLGGLKTLLRKIDATDSVERRSGSGRPRTVRVPDVIANVQDLVLSQENAPKTHSSQRQIYRLVIIQFDWLHVNSNEVLIEDCTVVIVRTRG